MNKFNETKIGKKITLTIAVLLVIQIFIATKSSYAEKTDIPWNSVYRPFTIQCSRTMYDFNEIGAVAYRGSNFHKNHHHHPHPPHDHIDCTGRGQIPVFFVIHNSGTTVVVGDGNPTEILKGYAVDIEGNIFREHTVIVPEHAKLRFLEDSDIFDAKFGIGNWYPVIDFGGKSLNQPLKITNWIKQNYS